MIYGSLLGRGGGGPRGRCARISPGRSMPALPPRPLRSREDVSRLPGTVPRPDRTLLQPLHKRRPHPDRTAPTGQEFDGFVVIITCSSSLSASRGCLFDRSRALEPPPLARLAGDTPLVARTAGGKINSILTASPSLLAVRGCSRTIHEDILK